MATSPPSRPGGTHVEREHNPWQVSLVGPEEVDTPAFLASRAAVEALAASVPDLLYGQGPFEVHRGGGLWLRDDTGWFLVRNIAGIDSAAVTCADPAKVDALRANAQRVYAGFPGTAAALGIEQLLATPVTDDAGVQRFVDSVLNASVPLPPGAHHGTPPAGAGVHDIPEPIQQIPFFKQDDFQLWVTDPASGQPVAVMPVGPAGGLGSDVRVIWAPSGTETGRRMRHAERGGQMAVAPAAHPIAQQAFAVRLGLETPAEAAAGPRSSAGGVIAGDGAWAVNIRDHPTRSDSPEYVRSRAAMNRIAATTDHFLYGKAPWQDHHGGGLWLKDPQGWFLVRNLAGMEWSSQFCADPAKVDALRLNARRIYAGFPDAVAELGIRQLLDTPITDAAGIAAWVDSICNASVPLPAGLHTGVLPKGAGVHHYPAPVMEIQHVMRDGFALWVPVPGTHQRVAVTPARPTAAGVPRTRLLWADPATELGSLHAHAREGNRTVMFEAGHPVTRAALARQSRQASTPRRGGAHL